MGRGGSWEGEEGGIGGLDGGQGREKGQGGRREDERDLVGKGVGEREGIGGWNEGS